MKITSLEELFTVLLSDIFYVENQLLEAIPEMTQKVQSRELVQALQNHLKETRTQVDRLKNIFRILDIEPVNVDWINNMQSLFDKARKVLNQNEPSAALDATIIVLAQRIEHYEIATYGTLHEFSNVLGYKEIKDILKTSLKEETTADALLNKLAEGGFFSSGINAKAAHQY